MNPLACPEPYRPRYHFSPHFGWINDPNGLVYHDGVWHLFHQYYPMDTVWGPMHWGHSVSVDLVNWQALPIALAPDERGFIFSGSVVIDEQNTSGLFKCESQGNLVAFYTASLNLPLHKMIDVQSQCLAYSQDGGFSWTKYENNPVISNPFISCFRDPKVIWHAPTKHWVMVVTCGQSIGFYRSQNLLDWEKCSEFGLSEGFHSEGPWECPDLFEMALPNGEKKWALIVGIGRGCFEGSSGTQYFIGDFDGQAFANLASPAEVKWLDIGRDYYATQTWFNAPDQKHIGISWFSNWQYARDTDTKAFRGSMTSAKEYRLIQSNDGYWITQGFAADTFKQLSLQPLSLQETHSIHHDVFYVKARISFERHHYAELSLYEGELKIGLYKKENGLQVELTRHYQGNGNEQMKGSFPHHYSYLSHINETSVDVEFFIDHGLTELHLAEGQLSISQLAFPERVKTTPLFIGDWQDIEFSTLGEK